MSEQENPYMSPAEAAVPAPVEEAQLPAMPDYMGAAAVLWQQGRSGANWFYWVAALTVVNCLLIHGGAGRHFVVGLGSLLIVDSIAAEVAVQEPNAAGVARAVAIAIDVVVVLMVAACGWLSNKRWTIVFAIGMVLYLLDGLLFLMMGDIMSVGFHAFALWGMWGGWQAYRKLNKFEAALAEELAAQPAVAAT